MPHSAIITPWSATLGIGSLPVLPDGCRDLILRISDDAPAELFLTSLDSAPRMVNTSSTTRYVGLRFRPGTRFTWEGKKADVENDMALYEQHELIGKWVARVLRRPEQADELLLDAAEQWTTPADCLGSEFIQALHQGHHDSSSFAISERQLRRHIVAQTGRPPAFWRQLHRARLAARDIMSGASPLAVVANDSGYADQAHLSREMRRWFGVTPGQLRATPGQYAHHFDSPDAFSL